MTNNEGSQEGGVGESQPTPPVSPDPETSTAASDVVDKANAEFRADPTAADSPPKDIGIPADPGPEWANKPSTAPDDETTPAAEPRGRAARRRVGAARAAFVEKQAARKTARSERKTEKDNRPKSPSQLRQEKQKAARQMSLGTRYGGDRYKWAAWTLVALLVPIFSIAALLIALQKPSLDDINTRVDKAIAESGRGFPEGQAVMWAGQVATIWGTWDEEVPETRATALSPYLSSGMDRQAGWNERGTQQIVTISVNPKPTVVGENHAVVHAVYQRTDGSWNCLDVPTYAYQSSNKNEDKDEGEAGNAQWAFALAANPTPSACTPRTGAPSLANTDIDYEEGGKRTIDADVSRTLASDFFPGFFSAWAASDSASLNQYTTSGVTVLGLGGSMASVPAPTIGDAEVYLPENGPKEDTEYAALVPVTWTISGTSGQATSVYAVTMTRSGDRWYVADEPTAAPQTGTVNGGSPATIPNPGDGVTGDTAPQTTADNPTAPSETDVTTEEEVEDSDVAEETTEPEKPEKEPEAKTEAEPEPTKKAATSTKKATTTKKATRTKKPKKP